MNSRIKNQLLLPASSSQYFWWELDKEEEPQLLWVEAAGSVWDLESCGAPRSSRRPLRAEPTVIQSEHRYCNISHSHLQTYTLQVCTHTHRNKSTAAHIRLSHPKGIHNHLTNRREKKKKTMRKAEWKKKNTLQNTQKASESTARSCLSDAAWGAGFWIRTRWAPKHRCSLSIHLQPWGKEARQASPSYKNTTRDLFDHLQEGHLDSFFARGTSPPLLSTIGQTHLNSHFRETNTSHSFQNIHCPH